MPWEMDWSQPQAETADAPPWERDWSQPQAEAEAQPGLTGRARALMLGTQAVGRGLADIAGAPVDLASIPVNMGAGLINRIFGTEIGATNPVGGSESIANLFSNAAGALGVPMVDPESMSPQESIGSSAIRFGTAGLGAGGLISRGVHAGRITPNTPVLGPMAPVYQQHPGASLARDLGGGLGAGTGVGVVEEALPEDTPIPARVAAETAAGLAGGLGGAALMGAPGGTVAAGRTAYRRLTPDRAIAPDPETGLRPTKSAASEAARITQGRVVDEPKEVAGRLRGEAQFFADEGLPTPSSGILSNDEGLIALERRARLEDPVPFQRRDREINTRAGRELRSLEPETTAGMTPDERHAFQRQATGLAERTVAGRRTAAEKQVSTAEERTARIHEAREKALQKEADMVAPVAAVRGQEGAASRQLDRAITEGALEPRTQAKNQAIAAIDPQKSVTVDSAPVVATAKQIRDEVGRLLPENMAVPREFTDRIEKLAKKTVRKETGLVDASGKALTRAETTGGTVTVGELVEIRPQLSSLIEKARNTGNFRLADNLKALKGQINDELDSLIARGGPGSAEAAAAKRVYEQEYAPFFAEGYGRKFRDAVQRSTERPAPSLTADFFFDGTEEGAKAVQRILSISKNRTEGEAAVRRYLTASLARAVNPEGKANYRLVNKWTQDHEDILRQFPGFANEVRGFRAALAGNRAERLKLTTELREASDAMRAAKANRAQVERSIGNSALSILVNADPVKAATNALGARDPQRAMREIVGTLRSDKKALEAWKSAVVESLERRVTTTATGKTLDSSDPVAWAASHKAFRDNRPALQALFNKEEMEALNRVHRLLEPMNRLALVATPGSDTASNLNQMLRPLEAVLRWKYGHLRTGGIMRSIRLTMSTIPGMSEQAAVNRLLHRMQLEPQLAAHLLEAPVDTRAHAGWNARLRKLLVAAEAGRTMAEE